MEARQYPEGRVVGFTYPRVDLTPQTRWAEVQDTVTINGRRLVTVRCIHTGDQLVIESDRIHTTMPESYRIL